MGSLMSETSRLRSLDAFRGLAIAGMILVNNPGSWSYVYPPLDHAPWHGWTPTDLVFPFFLFAVGASLTFSFARRRRDGSTGSALLRKIIRRSAVLFAIGLLLNFVPSFDLHTLRIPGVLQRIAVVYLVAASLYLILSPRVLGILGALLLVGYWLAMTRVPVPGYGAGVLEPVGNLAQHIDSHLLAGHMWKPDWDPEGLLSTVPAIVSCLLGIYAGLVLQRAEPPAERAARLALAGFAALVLGWVWSFWFPINKNLWTSSYVLFTGGLALLLLATLYWWIDIRQRKAWSTPLCVFGVNALLAFVLSGLLARLLIAWKIGGTSARAWIYEHWFASWAGPLNGSLAFAVAYVLLWFLILLVLDKRRWYVKL
jgi:predicted acyltransferase